MKSGIWKLGFVCCLVACDSKAPETAVSKAKSLPPLDVTQKFQEKISDLQKDVAALREENERLRSGIPQASPADQSASSGEVKISPIGVKEPPSAELISPHYLPERGILLTHEQIAELKTGALPFRPTSIASSGIPVTSETPLQIGQDLQMKWGTTWWAATVVGFETDGGIRMHYFGWDSTHDEIVPRSDLQVDTGVREKAIQTVYQLPAK